ncbi:unnamed protein product [Porites lobata]|uniref:Uncharacterized protein n=1 Tax=Porites lobata TaxID=104759 RepID=A0ABN8P4T0_9CNID|nr:unnamed protein product [Porites lobata]
MENISYLKTLRNRGDFLRSVDLKDAHLSVHYLSFQWRDENICLSRPPISAKYSFQIFLKLLKPAACLSAKERGVKSQHLLILHLLHGVGFTINWEKSVLELTQSLTFLDFSINSLMMSFSLQEEKS